MQSSASQSERRPREYLNLVLGVVSAIAVWYGLSHRDTIPGSDFDMGIGIAIAGSCLLAAVVQLIMTRVWTIRAVGLLFILLGMAVYFGITIAYTNRTGDRRYFETSLDVVRALFLIGVPALVVGLLAGFVGWLLRKAPDEGF